VLTGELAWIRDAFWELGTCRPGGMGMAPIPWTAIKEYADAEGVLDRHRFEALIRRMDREIMDAYRRRYEEGKRG
jgi:hypothetical protein